MAQRRYFDFIADLSQVNLQDFLTGLFPSGVYSGCDLSITPDGILTMSAGKYLTNTGLMVQETDTVEIGVLGGQAAGTSQVKTILGLGAALNTVQRSSIDYIINDGIATETELKPLNQPFIILGFARYNGSEWSASSIKKVEFSYSAKPAIQLAKPFPGVAGALERSVKAKAVVERKAIASTSTRLVIPLNNVNPLKSVNISYVDSSEGISVEAYTFSADNAEKFVGSGVVGSDGILNLNLTLTDAGLVDACLVLKCSSANALGTALRFSSISYEQDSTFFSL